MSDLSAKPKILFVSQTNNGINAVAQIIAQQLAGKAAIVCSAAAKPFRKLQETAVMVLQSKGYRVPPEQAATELVIPLDDASSGFYDAVIHFEESDLSPWIPGFIRETWPLEKATDLSESAMLDLISRLEEKIQRLLSRICVIEAPALAAGA